MAQDQVSFDIMAANASLINKIVDRAVKIFKRHQPKQKVDRLSLTMDITAVHANGCKLRLADLLTADEFNFLHDVVKIKRHIDRNTGQLTDHFLPRFHARSERPS